MIQVNGVRYRVVRLACGYLFRLKPETNEFTNNGEVINYDQLRGLVDFNFLESEMSKETGGPAFPVPDSEYQIQDTGMTLRDHFAGLAMGLCFVQYLNHAEVEGLSDGWRDGVALEAYMMADAMIRARGE